MEGKKSPKNSQVQSFICLFKHKGPSGNSCPSQAGMEFTFSCSRIFLVSTPHLLWKATLLGRCPIVGSSRFCGRLCTAKVSVSVFIPCLLYRSPFRGLTTAWEGAQGGSGENDIVTSQLAKLSIPSLQNLIKKKVVCWVTLLSSRKTHRWKVGLPFLLLFNADTPKVETIR